MSRTLSQRLVFVLLLVAISGSAAQMNRAAVDVARGSSPTGSEGARLGVARQDSNKTAGSGGAWRIQRDGGTHEARAGHQWDLARSMARAKSDQSGALDALRSNVGIIYHARGRIAMAITCHEMPEVNWTVDNPAMLLMLRLSEIIIEGLGK